MARISRTSDDLEEALKEQLAFLDSSCDAFDRGFASEAKRLAVTVRVLVHDTPRSRSLITQLGKADTPFYDSALDLEPGNLLTHSGLVMTAVRKGGSLYVPMLDGMPTAAWIGFDEWWAKPVFVDDRGEHFTRKGLVLTMADQDGGAHVDPALDEAYHRLTRANSMGWVDSDGRTQRPLPDPAGPSMRQIAHEVLKSLRPGYARKANHQAEVFVGGAGVFDSPVPPGFVPVAGRNEPCPCGSGKKYKKCHGALRTT